MKNTMTYATALTNAIALTEGETRETLERLLNSVNKRNTRKANPEKLTPKQKENEVLKGNIREVLASATEPMTCKAIAETVGVSVQKVNAMLIQMNKGGELAKSEGKKKVTLFALADADADAEPEEE